LVLIITGPTATGKTRLGVLLAKKLGGEIISADSMQIYRGMDIGTAKPGQEEMEGVPHHMLDIVEPDENYSVARYAKEATACVQRVLEAGKLPIIVGGTGLYIDALITGKQFAEGGKSDGLRDMLSERFCNIGGEAMLEELSRIDPESADKLHPNDKKRITRAFEVYMQTGKTISEYNRETRSIPPRYNALKIALSYKDREKLYERIDTRVDEMVERGLLEEARRLIDGGLSSECTAMQAIGYKELAGVIAGEYDMGEAVEKIKRESRRYAKRQLTWLRRDESVHWIQWEDAPDFDTAVRISTQLLNEFGI